MMTTPASAAAAATTAAATRTLFEYVQKALFLQQEGDNDDDDDHHPLLRYVEQQQYHQQDHHKHQDGWIDDGERYYEDGGLSSSSFWSSPSEENGEDQGLLDQYQRFLSHDGDNTSTSSAPHNMALIVLPKIAATFSLLASIWLILEISVYSKNKLYYVYHKLVLSMAVYTMLGSLWYWIGHWTTTDVDDHQYNSSGAFCQSQGFMLQISMLGTSIYFCMLFVYYVLVITLSYSEDQLTTTLRSLATANTNDTSVPTSPRRMSLEWKMHIFRARKIRQYCSWMFCSFDWERLFHLVPLIGSIATAIAAILLDLLYPVFGALAAVTATSPSQRLEVTSSWCWIAPSTSSAYDGTVDLAGEIQRAGTFQWAFYLGPAWACFGLMLVSLFIVFRGVASQEERMKKYVTTSQKIPKRKSDAAKFTASFIRPKTVNDNGLSSYPTNNLTTIASNSDHQQEMMMNSVSQTKNASDSNINAVSSHSNSNSTSQPSKSEIDATKLMQISNANQVNFADIEPVEAESASIHSYASSLVSSWIFFKTSLSSALCIPAFKEYWDHRPRTRQVVVQAMCYVGSFFWCNIFLTVNQSVASRSKGRIPYALLLLQVIYQPLLGFFILLSYRRPTYMRMRRTGKSRWKSLLTSMEWNSHPVEKPRQQRRISASSVAASIASRKRRKEQKRLKKERQKQLKEHKQKMADEREELRKKRRENTRQRKVQLPDEEERKRRASAPSGSFHGSAGALQPAESRNPRRRSFFMNLLNQGDDNPKNSLAEDSTGPLVDGTQRAASAPVLPTLPPGDFGDVGSWESTLSPTDDSTDADRNQASKISRNGQILSDSFSTLSTRRQSELTKEGSSRQFRSGFQKEDSMSLGDLLKGQSSEELSFDLDDMIGIDEEEEEDISFEAEDDDDDDDDDYDHDTTTNRDDEESTVESLHDSSKRRLGFNFFGRREPIDSFQMVKQQSERYMDLCAMDIIPEADGAIEEKWRQIESQSTRYERGKHDRYKLHMSVPIISDRNLAGLSHPSPPHRNTSSTEKQIRSRGNEAESGNNRPPSRDSPRFAWSKLNANPLFKMSGRWNSRRDLMTSQPDQKAPPSPNTSSSSIGFRKNRGSATNTTESSAGLSRNSSTDSCNPVKKAVGRTSSGGYFVGSTEKDRPDDQFWSKIALEKKRKDVLKAISSRFSGSGSNLTSSEEISKGFNNIDPLHPDNDNKEGKASSLLNESNVDDDDETDSVKHARRTLEDARRDLERNISMRELQEVMMADQDYVTIDQDLQLEMQDYDLEMGEPDSEDETMNRPVITKSNSGSRWLERARQDIVNTVNRLSSRSLDNIPEVSEHSHTDSPKYDRRKLMLRGGGGGSQRRNGSQRRISSGEFSNKRSSASSEMISESSNDLSTVGSTRTLKRSNTQQRKSESSDGMSSSQLSAELSLVSDTPMSDDDFMSETSVDFNGDQHIDLDDKCVTDDTDQSPTHISASTNRRNSGSSNSNGSSQRSTKNTRMQQKQKVLSRRSMFTDSCNSMERLSERSIEDYLSESSKSFHIDTSEMFKATIPGSDPAPSKVDETVHENNHLDIEKDNYSESSDDTEYA